MQQLCETRMRRVTLSTDDVLDGEGEDCPPGLLATLQQDSLPPLQLLVRVHTAPAVQGTYLEYDVLNGEGEDCPPGLLAPVQQDSLPPLQLLEYTAPAVQGT